MPRKLPPLKLPSWIKKHITTTKEKHLVWAVLSFMGAGKGQIAEQFGNTRRAVEIAINNMQHPHRSPQPVSDSTSEATRSPPTPPPTRQAIADIIANTPKHLSIYELQHLLRERDIQVSNRTVKRHIKKIGHSLKLPSKICRANDPDIVEERSRLSGEILEVLQDDSVIPLFLDESSFQECDQTKVKLISPIGERAYNPQLRSIKSENITMTLLSSPFGFSYTLTPDKMTADKSFKITKKMVTEAINALGNHHNYALFLDNAPIHDKERLERFCEKKGIDLRFLSRYTPDLNACEYHFSHLKANLMVIYHLRGEAQSSTGSFQQFIGQIVDQVANSDTMVRTASNITRHVGKYSRSLHEAEGNLSMASKIMARNKKSRHSL